MSEEEEEVVCSTCGRNMHPNDVGKRWRECEWCKKPVCFDCSRYFGVKTPGLYSNYLKVVRLCKKCYPEMKGLG